MAAEGIISSAPPPTQMLANALSVEKLVKIGQVSAIVDMLVVVEALRDMPPLDLDSVLFKADGTAIGIIDDVFGSIKAPLYSLKFDSGESIVAKQISAQMPVYFVPQAERSVTKFVFVSKLMEQCKGSDASWVDDQEPPEDQVEYSDDEEERSATTRKRKDLSSSTWSFSAQTGGRVLQQTDTTVTDMNTSSG